MNVLMLRRGKGNAVIPFPIGGMDAIEIGALICRVAGDGAHDATEWCVTSCTSTRTAAWPDPEPWRPPPAVVPPPS